MSFLTNRSIVYSTLGKQGIKSLALLAAGLLVVGWLILPILTSLLLRSDSSDTSTVDRNLTLDGAINTVSHLIIFTSFLSVVLRRSFAAADLEVIKIREYFGQFLIAFLMASIFLWLLRQYFVAALITPLGLDSIFGRTYYSLVTSAAFLRFSAIILFVSLTAMILLDMARPATGGVYNRFIDALRDGPGVSVRILALAIVPVAASAIWRHWSLEIAWYFFRNRDTLTYGIYLNTSINLILNAIWFLFVVGIAEILLRQVPEVREKFLAAKTG